MVMNNSAGHPFVLVPDKVDRHRWYMYAIVTKHSHRVCLSKLSSVFEETYFVKEHSDSKNKYAKADITKMLEFLVDNIFVVFAGKVFQQTVGIPMGTKCAPLLADIFLYSYEADFIQSLLNGKETIGISVQSHLQVHR